MIRTTETRKAHKILVGNSKDRRLLSRPRRRWKGTIKMDVKETVCDEDADCTHVA